MPVKFLAMMSNPYADAASLPCPHPDAEDAYNALPDVVVWLEFDDLPKDRAIRAAAYCDHAYARHGDQMLANSKTGHDLRQRLNADFHRLFGPKSGRPFKWPIRIAPAPTLTDQRRRSILNAMKIGARAGARKQERAEWSVIVKEADARQRRWDYYMSYHWEFGVFERPKSILEDDPAYAEAIMSGAVEPGWIYAFDDDGVRDDDDNDDGDGDGGDGVIGDEPESGADAALEAPVTDPGGTAL
jgi:hypothetical protein